MDIRNIRGVLLEVIEEQGRQAGSLQARSVFEEAAKRLQPAKTPVRPPYGPEPPVPAPAKEPTKEEFEQAVLTAWYDLFRAGIIAWGIDFGNHDPPFVHLTEKGRRALSSISRDPSNPDGYMGYLRLKASLSPIAESYISEALETYNNQCFKATAVMVGAAAECLVLELRDCIVEAIKRNGNVPPRNLMDWKVKIVLEAIQDKLKCLQPQPPKALLESFEAQWTAIVYQIRTARNEAGHPASLDPVEEETVHGNLLLFPELAKLTKALREWVGTQSTTLPPSRKP